MITPLMQKTLPLLLLYLLISCNDDYQQISTQELQEMSVQDTLVRNSKVWVFSVGDSVTDVNSRLVVQPVASKSNYLFHYDCALANDSTIISYYPAFVIDEVGAFRKNGLWVYAEFYREGTFPFHSNGIRFSVDSIPKIWNRPLPNREGIYFYENDTLELLSLEQSEEKFKEKRRTGFYFFPNHGRLFDRIHLNEIE